ncbi:MAG: Eco57I restriction-modification methylase domain-containing protein, partial [Caldisphaera sp.]
RYIFSVDDSRLNGVIRQLFFEVLNEKPTTRKNIDPKFQTIPYLNGSLFLMTETERRNPDYKINAEILRAIIEFLDSFRFVHTEKESDEKVLDPEILGYIFERSMTAKNRKGTGAYYTPKEVTRYITENAVSPSIIKKVNALLASKGYKPNELIDRVEDIFNLKEMILKDIYYKVLPEIKICDNACGSGAFLLSAAEFLFSIYNRINMDLRLKQSEKSIRRTIIKENLYGVDINPNAIEVAKLRLWLWLTEVYEPTAVEPLPNIEYNLKVGNTLFGYINIDKFKTIKQGLNDWINEENSLITLLPEREKLISKYKDASGDEAREIRWKIEEFDGKIKTALDANLYSELVIKNNTLVGKKRRKRTTSTKIISEDDFKKIKPFHWGFEFYNIFSRTEGGFDVIIGNPPYGNIFQQKSEKQILAKKVAYLDKNKRNTSLNGAALFIDRTYELLMNGGFTGYIVPNSISRIDEFNGLRNFILENTKLLKIVDEGKPFIGVTLEMISIFYKKIDISNKDYKILIVSKRKGLGINENVVKKSIFMKYKRFMLYWDEFYERIASASIIGFLDGTRGITISSKFIAKNKDSKFNIPILMSGKSVKHYILDYAEFVWGKPEIFSKSSSAKESFDEQCLVSTRLSFTYRVAIKPKGYIAADNVIRLNFDERKIDKKVMMAILNSEFMKYITIKYLNNYITLTMFINSITKATPIRIPSNQPELIKLVDSIIELKKQQKIKGNNQELEKKIKAVDQAINKQVYDLYEVTKDEQRDIRNKLINYKLILKKR